MYSMSLASSAIRFVPSNRAPRDGPDAPPIHLAPAHSGLNSPMRPISVRRSQAASGEHATSTEADALNSPNRESLTEAASGLSPRSPHIEMTAVRPTDTSI